MIAATAWFSRVWRQLSGGASARVAEARSDDSRHFRAVMAHMSNGVIMVDADYRIVHINATALDFYGVSADVIGPGTPMREAVERSAAKGNYPDQDADGVWASRLALFSKREPGQLRQTLPSGRVIDLHVSPLEDGGWLLLSYDVTAQALAEAEVRAQSRRFETALSNMADGLLMLDADWRLVVCNSRYRELLGLSAEIARPGTPLADLVAHATVGNRDAVGRVDEMIADRKALLERGERCSLQFVTTDGRHIEIVYNPVPDGGWVATYSDITRRKEAEARIHHMARHDSLTDLPNRNFLQDEIGRALAQAAKAAAEPTAVLCLDLDRFKPVNDTFGHALGDELLRTVADRLRSVASASGGFVARLGGDEFALLLAGTGAAGANAVAERVIAEVSRPYDLGGREVTIGSSIGIAIGPADGDRPDEILRAADLALYRVKSEGRGSFCFFEPDMNARMRARRDLEHDLREGLALEQFEVHYQPLVRLDTDQITGFEALVRWRHPVRGLVPPAEFIPMAEEVGLIVPLGEWVLRQACRDAVRWPKHISIAVNLSPVQFQSQALVLTVAGALGAAGLDPRRLELEITEGVLLQGVETTYAILNELKSMGVRISMDDFGTGYSSLNYLRTFHFDKIKIDRAFVDGVEDKADVAAIVRAVTSMGKSLGVSTTAEGVETQGQLDYLRAQGCDEVQGYLISRPVPAHDIPGLLARGSAAWCPAPPEPPDAAPPWPEPRRGRGGGTFSPR